MTRMTLRHRASRLALAALIGAAAFFVGGRLAPDAAPGAPARAPAAAPEPPPVRKAFMMEKAFYDEAFAGGTEGCPSGARGAIVNHHLLAKNLIAETLGCLDPRTPAVVLIAPNHFGVGAGPVLSSRATWTTPYGDLPAAREIIAALEERGALRVDEAPFAEEHGVGNVVAFIRRALPGARVIPVILKDAARPEAVAKLAADLEALLPPGSAVVASLDFSHELTPAAARHADARSLRVIASGAMPDSGLIDVDSAPGLRLALALTRRLGAPRFTLLRRSDSSEVTKRELDDTTSYLVGAFSPGEPEAPKLASVLAIGDVMLDRGVKNAIDRRGLDGVLGTARRLLIGSDAVVANFEGAVSADPSPPDDPERPTFVVEDELLAPLARRGFTHFSLANNHAYDAGPDGPRATRQALDRVGLRAFGDPDNAIALSASQEIGGLEVAFVGYHAFRPGLENVLEEVRRLDRSADVVVVMTHWGAEYQATPTADQRRAAAKLVEAGADVVLGAHPHVIQPVEIVDGRPVFWSLGNFLFDQAPPATRVGLAVGMRLAPESMAFSLIPVESVAGSLRLVPYARRDTILKTLGYPSGEFILPISAYARGPADR